MALLEERLQCLEEEKGVKSADAERSPPNSNPRPS
jgi:hypothetical protein